MGQLLGPKANAYKMKDYIPYYHHTNIIVSIKKPIDLAYCHTPNLTALFTKNSNDFQYWIL